MKVAIFENEFIQVETAFKAVNLMYFQNQLDFEVFPSSQKLNKIEDIQSYRYIIVDIDLSINSELDGFSLISKILEFKSDAKIIILTGHSKIEEKLKEKNIKMLPIISKPVTFQSIYQKLTEVDKAVNK